MAMRGPNCVFVGSIPFDTTEEQLKDIFSQVGPVQMFKIVFDKETGKSRGFGFCEYFDAETAKSAIRNLNNYDLRGRVLKVGPTETSALQEIKHHGMTGHQADQQGSSGVGMAGGVNIGLSNNGLIGMNDLKLGQFGNSKEYIEKIIEQMELGNVIQVLHEFKMYLAAYPEKANYLLVRNPQLATALLECLKKAKVVDDATIEDVILVKSTETKPNVSQPPPPIPSLGRPPNMPPRPPSNMFNFPPRPPMGMGAPPPLPGLGVVGTTQPQLQKQAVPFNQQPPPMKQPQQQTNATLSSDEERELREAVEAVRQLSWDQINACPPEQKEYFTFLKLQLEN